MDVQTAMQGLPDIDFRIISGELWREYLMESGKVIRIPEPLLLHVSKSGGHYIINAEGLTRYIPYKWDSLTWLVKQGEPLIHFTNPRG